MTPLGTFAVAAALEEVEAFRAATGLAPSDEVPATFPMRWLAAPEVRTALLAMMSDADIVPVHESQTFEYLAPLSVGMRYVMRLEARREASPDRLVLAGTIATPDGTVAVQLETILRLFSASAVAA